MYKYAVCSIHIHPHTHTHTSHGIWHVLYAVQCTSMLPISSGNSNVSICNILPLTKNRIVNNLVCMLNHRNGLYANAFIVCALVTKP